MVIRAQIRRQIEVERERAPGLALGFARLYIEARTLALVAGNAPIGESLRYLVDVPLDERGKVPELKKQEVLLFANPVAGRAGEVQLSGPGAQQMYSPELEARLRPILADLVARDAPPVVTGVRDALSVPGNLAGESETQIFLETSDGSPVSLTILHRPGRSPVWGVSWGEIIDQAARPPEPETIRWYRLACALPDRLPSGANLSRVPGRAGPGHARLRLRARIAWTLCSQSRSPIAGATRPKRQPALSSAARPTIRQSGSLNGLLRARGSGDD